MVETRVMNRKLERDADKVGFLIGFATGLLGVALGLIIVTLMMG